MALSQFIIDQEEEIDRAKVAAGVFADEIIDRHIEWRETGKDYTAEDLVKGTIYEGVVVISGSTVVYSTPTRQFVWLYIPRNGDETANLIEFSGFDIKDKTK